MHRSLAVALSLLACAAIAEPPGLELSAHVIVADGPREFGGLSAIGVLDGGTRAMVLSDRGKIFDVALWRDEDQRLTRVAVLRAKYLYVHDPHEQIDSEGLALGPDDEIFVSSEKPPAVLRYPAQSSWPAETWPVPGPEALRENRGLEALAMDGERRLVTLPEQPPPGMDGFPVYRLEDDGWHRIATLEAGDGFSVVGADFGPDGRLYVLERSFAALGFRSRIRRVSLDDAHAPVETLFESRLARFDNLEGISLWRDADGQVRITLVSDDNFLLVQRSEFVEFILRE